MDCDMKILVTGGAGIIGRHIIECFQGRADSGLKHRLPFSGHG